MTSESWKKRLAFVVALSLLSFWSAPVFAAMAARVSEDETRVLSSPRKDSPELRRLKKGLVIVTSNLATEGFFKARLADGTIGWVETNTVEQFATLRVPADEEAALKSGAAPRSGNGSQLILRGGGGITAFTAPEIDTVFGFSAGHFALNGTAEIGLQFRPRLSALLKFEYLSENVVAQDTVSRKTFEIGITGLPVLLGPEILLTKPAGRLAVRLGLFGGISLLTGLTSKSLNDVEPNLTVITGTTYAFLGRLLVEYPIYRRLNLGLDAGYRLVQTAQLLPTVAGNGSEVFQSSGTFVPLVTSINGPYVNALLSISL